MSDSFMDSILPNGKTAMSDDDMEALLLENARTGTCPPPDLLFAAEEDVLPENAGAVVREHVAQCALCRTLLAELPPSTPTLDADTSARIRARIQTRIDKSSSAAKKKPLFRLSVLSVAAVAAIFLAVAILGVVNYRLWRGSTNPSGAATNHSSAPSVLADIPELHHVTVLAPPDDVAALVMRGGSAGSGPTVEELLPAFRAYNRGDYSQAAADFASLATRFPKSDIPPLYLGVSQLELERNAAAHSALSQAYTLAGATRRDASAWYLAVADLRLNQTQTAAPLLRKLCVQSGSSYASRACALAGQLGPP